MVRLSALSMTLLLAAARTVSAADTGTEIQIGGVAVWELQSSGWHFGPSVSLEQELIERQLQLELGISRFHLSESTAWEVDLGFKKPFELSPGVELNVGLGPTWTRTTGTAERSDSIGAEFSLDFQFLVAKRWGWYIEPAYEFVPGGAQDRSFNLAVGILIAF